MKLKMHLAKSPFDGFDWSILDSSDFLEDSVREEIITPLLWLLGYRVNTPHKIIRSKRLEHPFVAIGTTKHRILLVPDYLMCVSDRPAWILDAKSPKEDVLDPAHEAQAYSYACHRDIRVNWYAVCNGREFAAFHVGDMASVPRLRFPLDQLSDHWGDLWHALGVEFIGQDQRTYLKDFGVHLLKMGLTREHILHFPSVPIGALSRVGKDTFSIQVKSREEDGGEYLASFDFDGARMAQLLPLLPPPIAAQASGLPEPSILHIRGDNFPHIGIAAHIAQKMQENDKEHYLPLEVVEFTRALT